MAAYQFKFAANLSTMFNHVDMEKRFEEAKKKGFTAVEAQFLYDYDINLLQKAQRDSGLDVVLINSPIKGIASLHDFQELQFGIACAIGEEVEFMKSIHSAVMYANALNCRKIHIIAGLNNKKFEMSDQKTAFINNMLNAVEMVEEHNIIAVIEPMCAQVKENYFLNSFELAADIITEVGSEHLKLLLDVYHMHCMGMNVEVEIPKYLKHTAHVQISQTPNRNEPYFPGGEINYDKVFQVLEENNYKGYVGLEYTPSDTSSSYEWLKRFGIQG